MIEDRANAIPTTSEASAARGGSDADQAGDADRPAGAGRCGQFITDQTG